MYYVHIISQNHNFEHKLWVCQRHNAPHYGINRLFEKFKYTNKTYLRAAHETIVSVLVEKVHNFFRKCRYFIAMQQMDAALIEIITIVIYTLNEHIYTQMLKY